MGICGATPFFRPQRGPKNRKRQLRPKTMIFLNQSIDTSLLSFSLIGQKMPELWPKKRMPIYGIIDIFRDFLAHNSADY